MSCAGISLLNGQSMAGCGSNVGIRRRLSVSITMIDGIISKVQYYKQIISVVCMHSSVIEKRVYIDGGETLMREH